MGDNEREVVFLNTFCRSCEFFAVDRVLGNGSNGAAFLVRNTHPDNPFPGRCVVCVCVCVSAPPNTACRVCGQPSPRCNRLL